MSLRARLLVGVVLLAGLGLVVAGSVTYALIDRFLTSRVDEQLQQAMVPITRALVREGSLADPGAVLPRPRRRLGGPRVPPPGTYGALVRGGVTVLTVPFDYGGQAAPPPVLPAAVPIGAAFSADARGGSWRYRVLAEPVANGVVVAAVPLTEVSATLDRLLAVEAVVAVAVLVALAALSAYVVGVGLRPLRRMEETAEQIAAGDLSRRVEGAGGRGEVGRLATAFNTMLARIEEAFSARAASEQRMRGFLADASHELRTPLTSIRGYAELFRRGADRRPDDLAKAMRRIEEEAGRMGVLVDDLLLLARLDEGRPMLREPVDVSAVVATSVEDLRAADPTRPVTVDVQPGVVVSGDEARLRQVVGNLTANVRTHTPRGTPVEVSLRADGGDAVLRVADRGPGLPAGQAQRVFERFYRADPARSRDGAGAGLGLAIVASVVAAHAGSVHAANRSGGGAQLTVRLPLLGRAGAAGVGARARTPSAFPASVDPGLSIGGQTRTDQLHVEEDA